MKNYKLLWVLETIEEPKLVGFYRFFLQNDWSVLQKDSLYQLFYYYECLLSMPDRVAPLFNKLDKDIQKICTKNKQDIRHNHLLECLEIINNGQTFFQFGEMEYRSIEKYNMIPNAIKILIDDYEKMN
jgi:hypothetical protein